MNNHFSPTHSETLVFIGAGATAKLGMPSTRVQTDVFREMIGNEADYHEILSPYFSGNDLEKIILLLKVLDMGERSFFDVSEQDVENIRKIYEMSHTASVSEERLRNRVMELRSLYDWNATKQVLLICPEPLKLSDKGNDKLIFDAYSIIDKKLLAGQSLKVTVPNNGNSKENVLPVSRLKGARNFIVLFVNMMFASAWYKISIDADPEIAENFETCKRFISSFDKLMRKEGFFFRRKYDVSSREFYLFTTSFVSFNFEMIFPWIFMNSHYELNHHPVYMENHPLHLWLDYGCEHRGRKTDGNEDVIPTLEFTESVASRENEDTHIGTPLNRAAKFYFAHGSSNWRECPVCGRMTFYFGYSKNKWDYKSKEMISPFPIPLFECEKMNALTAHEKEWRKELKYDSLQCMHCGAETHSYDAPMIMQTMYKSSPTSFLEEIQRNVRAGIEKARHIVLLGYQLPVDDTIWYHSFAESIRSKTNDDAAFCTVVVGFKGEEKWLYGDDIIDYVKKHETCDEAEDFGVPAIKSALSIFKLENVRVWAGGIPQVFKNADECAVRELFYPDFVNWSGTRLEVNM